MHAGRVGIAFCLAGMHTEVGELPHKSFNDHGRNIAAAIAPYVNDQSFFGKLRVVMLHKFIQARCSHIRNMNIAGFASGFLVNVCNVLLHPFIIVQV